MKKMLCESFFRLVKSMECWLGMVLTVVFTLISSSAYIGRRDASVDEWAFGGINFMFIFGSAVIGLFLFHDYSEGTLRLKISSGNSRNVFYIANLIISVCYMLALGLIYAITALLISRTDISLDGFDVTATRKTALLLVGIIISNSAITTFVGMSFKNVLGAITPMLINVIMTFLMIFISNGSDEGSFGKLLAKALPYGQTDFLSCITVPKELPTMLICAFLVSFIATVLGTIIFKYSDIK
ncbi:MAG: hypothetical protein K5884_02855 [Ruminococcus sp.]|nr:hypothetical protein [Ruminococcus sp.]